jgi:hypothetical protein
MASDPLKPILHDPSQLLLDAALIIVETHALKGGSLLVKHEAKLLVERHADSGMTAAEIEAELVRLAAKHRVLVA